ncbi:MAG: hypothetical protein ACXWJ7_02310 [Caldimonas sp.]
MNAKLLYAATVALALLSSLAVAGEAQPLTREQVVAAYREAAADGTLRKNDYDYDAHDLRAPSSRSRAEVIAELKAARPDKALIGPLRNRTYNPGGMETLRVSTLARAQVKAEVVAAMRDGTLRRTDYDDEGARVSRRAPQRSVAPVVARTSRTVASGG